MVKIRAVKVEDTEAFLNLNKQLDYESSFMLYEPDERSISFEQTRTMIESLLHARNSTIIVAEDNYGGLVGHLTVIGGSLNRIKHRAHIVIGIRSNFLGMGIGTKLFHELEKWRVNNGVYC